MRLAPVLRVVEDRRTYHPDRAFRSPRVVTGGPSAVVTRKQVKRFSVSRPFRSLSPKIQFDVPARTLVCIRRAARKEVLHAIGKAGGRVSRRRRRNPWTKVVCK